MNFYENLEFYLSQKGIKAATMCADLNIPKSSVSQWKNGSLPTCTNLLKITEYFNATPNDLLGIHGNEMTTEERELIEAYRKSSKIGKRIIQDVASAEAARGNLSDSPAEIRGQAN